MRMTNGISWLAAGTAMLLLFAPVGQPETRAESQQDWKTDWKLKTVAPIATTAEVTTTTETQLSSSVPPAPHDPTVDLTQTVLAPNPLQLVSFHPHHKHGHKKPVASKKTRFVLGIALMKISDEAQKKYNLPENVSYAVRYVKDGSAASQAGLKKKDILLAVNGKPATEYKTLFATVQKSAAKGATMTFVVLREGKIKKKITVRTKAATAAKKTAAKKPTVKKAVAKKTTTSQAVPVSLGIAVMGIDKPLREKYKLPKGVGFAIRGVRKGSIADKTGLKRKDVLLSFNNKDVKEYKALVRSVRTIGNTKKPIKVVILRDGKKQTLAISPKLLVVRQVKRSAGKTTCSKSSKGCPKCAAKSKKCPLKSLAKAKSKGRLRHSYRHYGSHLRTLYNALSKEDQQRAKELVKELIGLRFKAMKNLAKKKGTASASPKSKSSGHRDRHARMKEWFKKMHQAKGKRPSFSSAKGCPLSKALGSAKGKAPFLFHHKPGFFHHPPKGFHGSHRKGPHGKGPHGRPPHHAGGPKIEIDGDVNITINNGGDSDLKDDVKQLQNSIKRLAHALRGLNHKVEQLSKSKK